MVVAVDDGSLQLEVLVLGALAALAFIALFLYVAFPYLFADRRIARLGKRRPALFRTHRH